MTDLIRQAQMIADIREIRKLNENIPIGAILIDSDTILADIMDVVDFELTGISEEIFTIWEISTDKKSVENLFYTFTGLSFGEYIERCKRMTTREVEPVEEC